MRDPAQQHEHVDRPFPDLRPGEADLAVGGVADVGAHAVIIASRDARAPSAELAECSGLRFVELSSSLPRGRGSSSVFGTDVGERHDRRPTNQPRQRSTAPAARKEHPAGPRRPHDSRAARLQRGRALTARARRTRGVPRRQLRGARRRRRLHRQHRRGRREASARAAWSATRRTAARGSRSAPDRGRARRQRGDHGRRCHLPVRRSRSMVALLDENDLVRGVRQSEPESMSLVSRVRELALQHAARDLHGLDGADHLTGLYAMRRDVALGSATEARGFDIETEIGIRAKALRLRGRDRDRLPAARRHRRSFRPWRGRHADLRPDGRPASDLQPGG